VAHVKQPTTPRDRLDRLIDYGRKATRYWWLIAGAIVLGGVLSVVFAVTRPPAYRSWSVLFYQERIQSNVLRGGDPNAAQRNIGERYRELLLARSQLAQIVEDPALNPFPDVLEKDGTDAAVEELRKTIQFEARGANTFRIVYSDAKPARAQAVTEKLTKLLQDKEQAIRDDQVRATAAFAEAQKSLAQEELRGHQKKLAEFLVKHPEFAQDAVEGVSEGASIRARQRRGTLNNTPTSGNPRIGALERQRSRLRARLAAPATVAPVRIPREPSPARRAAQQVVDQAVRELQEAERSLEEAQSRFTEKHPNVIKAREQVVSAQQRVRRAQEAMGKDPDEDTIITPPATAADRAALERELSRIEQQLAAERRRDREAGSGSAAPVEPVDDGTNWVVKLETDYADLKANVDEGRERVEALEDSVFRAQIDAQQQLAEQGARLTVVDPAFKPVQPFGAGKRLLVMAGLLLFAGLGVALAFGLAIIDDRLYRRADIDELGLAPVLTVIPAAPGAKKLSLRREKQRIMDDE
jgi:uncharacterized protein involved in exopolysaccharide biosynthesis